MKKSFYLIILAVVCVYWGVTGFYIGTQYEKSNHYTDTHYIYKNKCFTIYKKAVLEYDCFEGE